MTILWDYIARIEEENQRLREKVEFLQCQSDELAEHLEQSRITQLQQIAELVSI